MSIRTKVGGSWRTVTQPWFKTDDITYRQAIKVYYKEAGTWREAWPLQPGPVTGVVTTTTYRNDRIEIDVDWDAPAGGEPVAKYIVAVSVGTSYTTTVEVIAPTTALTLTNAPSNSGYHTYAGQGAVAKVYAVSTAGRIGDTAQSATTPVSQLPAPPQPTSYSVSMWQCAMSHTWAHAGGRRIDGVEIHTTHNGGGASAWYNASTFSANYQSWNTSTIGGGNVICYCRTYGPGGVSNWLSVSGEMPNAIGASAFRFGDGYMRMNTWGVSPQAQIFSLRYGGSTWGYEATFGAGAGEVYAPSSVNWARDRTYYAMLVRPYNPNGWVGRDQVYAWAMKLPNPCYITPIDTATLRNGAWRGSESQDWQGNTQLGNNQAYFFYGGQFYDDYRAAVVGYTMGIHSAQIALRRETSGAVAAISPRLVLHRAYNSGGDLTMGGAYDTSAIPRNVATWCHVPVDWIHALREYSDAWRGLGLYTTDTALHQGLGYVSATYSIFTAWNYGTIDGGAYWLDTVRIYHNG